MFFHSTRFIRLLSQIFSLYTNTYTTLYTKTMSESHGTNAAYSEYECRECKSPVLYRSDHKAGCKYGAPIIHHNTYQAQTTAIAPSSLYTHPSMPGTPYADYQQDPLFNVSPN